MIRTALLPLFSVLLLLVTISCDCEQERMRRLLTNPQKISESKAWNLVKLYRKKGKTTEYKKKHVILFAANGYFNALFWRGDKFSNAPDVSSDVLSSDEELAKQHRWNFGTGQQLVVNGDTIHVERITKDTLILRGYPVEDGRSIYVRKTYVSDISFGKAKPSRPEIPIE